MGCGGSKIEGLEAVTLCRGRSDRLADAVRHRYALASAHAAYAASLRSVGDSLHRVLLRDAAAAPRPPSPVLPLPVHRKGDPSSPPAKSAAPAPHGHSRSHSGSHIQFHPSDSDSGSDADIDTPLHSPDSYPVHGRVYTNLHYARGQRPAPSVSFEVPEPVQFASVERVEPSPSSTYPYQEHSYSYAPQNANYSHPYGSQQNYYGYGGIGGFFEAPAAAAGRRPTPSASKAPPPPPSPPKASTWDFLNPFEAYQNYYPAYTPSRSSREVREEEGIPDLEEEEHVVIKEAYGDPKFAASTSVAGAKGYSVKLPPSSTGDGGGSLSQSRSAGSSSGSEDELDVVEKSVAHEERRSMAEPAAPSRYRDGSDVADEIKMQFDRAAESARVLWRVLEVGKLPYNYKSSLYEVSSRIMSGMAPPSASKTEDSMNFGEDSVMNSNSLSSTLQKLYVWEKKLYDEVKAEERMRVLHEKNCKRLMHLDEKGAESQKIDATRTLVRKLSTRIKISIRVVDSISNKINKLRDEELWPQINKLIKGLLRMWKVMLECHQTQCLAISEAKSLEFIASGGKLSDTCIDGVVQLELELLRWTSNFSDWIDAQKNYVKALNEWLVLCLHYEPEVTADGVPPYSPGRIGAPPVFVICNYWSQALDRISEREVIEAMQAFAANVKHLREHNDIELRQKMMAERETEKITKLRERDTQKIHKEIDALNKKLVIVSGHSDLPLYGEVRHQGHTAETRSLQLSLKHIFEAMDRFTASSLKTYEELQLRSEEERIVGKNSEVL